MNKIKKTLVIAIVASFIGLAIIPSISETSIKIAGQTIGKTRFNETKIKESVEQEKSETIDVKCLVYNKDRTVREIVKGMALEEAKTLSNQLEKAITAFQVSNSPTATNEEIKKANITINETLGMMKSTGFLPDDMSIDEAKSLLKKPFGKEVKRAKIQEMKRFIPQVGNIVDEGKFSSGRISLFAGIYSVGYGILLPPFILFWFPFIIWYYPFGSTLIVDLMGFGWITGCQIGFAISPVGFAFIFPWPAEVFPGVFILGGAFAIGCLARTGGEYIYHQTARDTAPT